MVTQSQYFCVLKHTPRGEKQRSHYKFCIWLIDATLLEVGGGLFNRSWGCSPLLDYQLSIHGFRTGTLNWTMHQRLECFYWYFSNHFPSFNYWVFCMEPISCVNLLMHTPSITQECLCATEALHVIVDWMADLLSRSSVKSAVGQVGA